MHTERIAHSLNELKEMSVCMKRSKTIGTTIPASVAVSWSVTLDSIIKELEGATDVKSVRHQVAQD